MSRLGTAYYFFHFLVILPLVGWLERLNPLPISISTPAIMTADLQ
jgi:ubiquinol-cytochrome c reductase cytochrome b subunit